MVTVVRQSEVRQDILDCFQQGECLGAHEIMQRTGRGRVVYRWIQQLVQEGKLEPARVESSVTETKRRRRTLFVLRQ